MPIFSSVYKNRNALSNQMGFHRIKIERSFASHPISAMFMFAHIFHKVRRRRKVQRRKKSAEERKKNMPPIKTNSTIFTDFVSILPLTRFTNMLIYINISNSVRLVIASAWYGSRTERVYSQNIIPATLSDRKFLITVHVLCFSSSSLVCVQACCFFLRFFFVQFFSLVSFFYWFTFEKYAGHLCLWKKITSHMKIGDFPVRNRLLSFSALQSFG